MLEENTKVKIKNTAHSPIHIGLPDSRFSRVWQPDSVYAVNLEIAREMVYDAGAKYFLDQNMLYIEDNEVRLELGLEPIEEKTSNEPKKITKILNRSQMLKLWRADSLADFESTLKEVHFEQMQALADFAIKEKIVDFAKAEVFKKYSNIDIVTALKLLQE